jgi:hypothetical protein
MNLKWVENLIWNYVFYNPNNTNFMNDKSIKLFLLDLIAFNQSSN